MIPGLTGPGSQPEEADGHSLDILRLPSGMQTYSAAHLPDTGAVPPAGLAAAEAILDALTAWQADGAAVSVSLDKLDQPGRSFLRELLGEGEVAVVAGEAQAQESVLAGVWYVRDADGAEHADIAPFPPGLLAGAFNGAAESVAAPPPGAGVFNAPALIAEINEHLPKIAAGALPAHTINLSLLPHTPEDLIYLDAALGSGALTILSRGYGNCRISATATRNAWWVRYFNSQDTLILDSIELSPVPEVALAAPEDIEDSRVRLGEILELYR